MNVSFIRDGHLGLLQDSRIRPKDDGAMQFIASELKTSKYLKMKY